MDKWSKTACSLWQAILARAQELKDEGETLQGIADKVGAKSRQNVKTWLAGMRKGDGIAFPELMTYAERLGIDYRNYFPGGEPSVQELPDCATCKKLLAKDREIQKLKRDIDRLSQDLRDERVRSEERSKTIDKLINANQDRQTEETPKNQAAAG